jgi:hypothetical protein
MGKRDYWEVRFRVTAFGVVVRREQTYWNPEALAAPVAVVITKSLQTKPQLPPILVLVLFVLSHLLSGLSCPCSASAGAVKRTMRMTRMVRTDVIAKQCLNPSRKHNKRPATSPRYGPKFGDWDFYCSCFVTRWGKHLKLDLGPMSRRRRLRVSTTIEKSRRLPYHAALTAPFT